MEIKIKIKTPKGLATKTEKRLRPFFLGGWKRLRKQEIKINKADNRIIWTIEDNPRKILKISKNVGRFDALMEMIMNNPKVKKKVPKDKLKELEQMLKDHTKVEIIETKF